MAQNAQSYFIPVAHGGLMQMITTGTFMQDLDARKSQV